MYLTDVFTFPASMAGLPALSVPCGFTAAGCPSGSSSSAGRSTRRRLLRVGPRLRAGHRRGTQRAPGAGVSGHSRESSSASRSTRSSSRAPRCSAAARPRSARQPNTPDLPDLPGHAGRAARRQPPGDRVRPAHGLALAAGSTRAPLRAQALLLSGHAEELPDLPVRGAPRRGRRARDRRWRGEPRRIGIKRLHLEEDAGKLVHEGTLDRRSEPGRLQPRRRAAHGDGVAGPTCARPRRPAPT